MLNNTYYLMRHGQALSNVKAVISFWPETFENHLTETGKKQVEESANSLKEKQIDIIFSSDILRAKETANILASTLKIEHIEYDARLREYNTGIYNGEAIENFSKMYPDRESRFTEKHENGETYQEIMDRMVDFLQDKEQKYKDKHIIVISHQLPLVLLLTKVRGMTKGQVFTEYLVKGRLHNAEVEQLQ